MTKPHGGGLSHGRGNPFTDFEEIGQPAVLCRIRYFEISQLRLIFQHSRFYMRDIVVGKDQVTPHGFEFKVDIVVHDEAVGLKTIKEGQVGVSAFFGVLQNFAYRISGLS